MEIRKLSEIKDVLRRFQEFTKNSFRRQLEICQAKGIDVSRWYDLDDVDNSTIEMFFELTKEDLDLCYCNDNQECLRCQGD